MGESMVGDAQEADVTFTIPHQVCLPPSSLPFPCSSNAFPLRQCKGVEFRDVYISPAFYGFADSEPYLLHIALTRAHKSVEIPDELLRSTVSEVGLHKYDHVFFGPSRSPSVTFHPQLPPPPTRRFRRPSLPFVWSHPLPPSRLPHSLSSPPRSSPFPSSRLLFLRSRHGRGQGRQGP